jgi:hypothetical protein
VFVPVLLHAVPPIGDLPLVRVGRLAQLIRLRLGRIPSGLDVLLELGACLALGGSSAVFCFFGSGRQFGELV